MNSSIQRLLLWLTIPLTLASFLLGVGLGVWSLIEDNDGRFFLARGLASCALLLAAAWLLASFVARSLARSIKLIQSAIEEFGHRQFWIAPRPLGPAEHSGLALQIRELGLLLERQEAEVLAQKRLEARNSRTEALQRFAQGALREVQKSMAGLSGFVELSLRQPNLEGSLKNYLKLIDQEAKNARETLEQILRYSRQEPFVLQRMDLGSVIDETMRDFASVLAEDHVKSKIHLAPNLPPVMGDPLQIKGSLVALIDNAREAMHPAGGTLEVSCNLDPKQHRVTVSIKDNGRGIQLSDHERVFTPFFTTKTERKAISGMNLAISERILALQQGELEFWSQPGVGTVFFMSLPLATVTVPPQESKSADTQEPSVSSPNAT